MTLMLDCDAEGEAGAGQSLAQIAPWCPVRLAWSSSMYGGTFKGRQPESFSREEWERVRAFLTRGGVEK